MGPLQYGISDRVQLGIHPILLLVGAVNLNLRWRLTDTGKKVTVATDLDVALSLLHRENLAGKEVRTDCTECGFPSRFRALATVSVEIGKNVLLSLGGGPSIDLISVQYARFMLALHGSLIWRITPTQLLMLHGSGYVGLDGIGAPSTPAIQIMYARACGSANIGLGVAFGDFPIARTVNQEDRWLLYPVMDLWWRF